MNVRRLRNRRDAIAYAVTGVFFTGIFVALAIGYAVDSEVDSDLVLVLLVLLYLGLSSAAFARAYVELRADEPFFVVRNMYRRYEVQWSEVAGFERDVYFGPVSSRAMRVVAAHLNDGRKLKCNALEGTPDQVGHFLHEMTAELKRRR